MVSIKTSQRGLQDGWTRAIFILRKHHLEDLKALAYWDRKTIKEVMDEALGSHQKEKNRTREEKEKEVIKMKKILVYLLVMVFLEGCFSTTGHWVKKSDSTSDEYSDRENCNRRVLDQVWRIEMGTREAGMVDYLLWFKLAGKRVAMSEGFGDDIKRFYFNKCMEAKGYEWGVEK